MTCLILFSSSSRLLAQTSHILWLWSTVAAGIVPLHHAKRKEKDGHFMDWSLYVGVLTCDWPDVAGIEHMTSRYTATGQQHIQILIIRTAGNNMLRVVKRGNGSLSRLLFLSAVTLLYSAKWTLHISTERQTERQRERQTDRERERDKH